LHYKGQLVHKEGGRFRFWCMGDNFMVVRVDGRVVLDFGNQFAHVWDGKDSKRTSYHLGHWPAWSGQWIDLEPGIPLDMEVVFGEYDGGSFAAMLVVEEEGVDYPSNREGGPTLPVFKTAELTRDQVDAIYADLYENHYSVTNGPVFCDYDVLGKAAGTAPEKPATSHLPRPTSHIQESALRTWTLKSGKSVEAEYIMLLGDKTVLKTKTGKQLKIPTQELSDWDLDYLELANPPPLKLTLQKELDRFRFKAVLNPYETPPVMTRITLGVKIEKATRKPYARMLKVELFSIAYERDGDNYVLLDRQEGTFTLSEENDQTHVFWGKGAYMRDYADYAGIRRGQKFKGHMIVITDERGEIIAKDITNDWFLDVIEPLRRFPVGRHFDETGMRVYPPRAKVATMFW
ncbi:MAG: SHD1 domain-containing protein, partial [Verrucomicrobiota bacterium]